MKLAPPLRMSLFTASLTLLLAAPLHAAPRLERFPTRLLAPEPILGFAGEVVALPSGVPRRVRPPNTLDAIATVYDNTGAAPTFGVSSLDIASVWGDELLLGTGGVLESHRFTIYNSSGSLGPLLSADVLVEFYDGASMLLGRYGVNVNFGAGVAPGDYTVVTVPGLADLAIDLDSMDIYVFQSLIGMTGTANRLGIVSLNPPAVGASPTDMYVESATIGGGVPGFYVFGAGPANPGHQIVSDTDAVPTRPTSWGRIKNLYR